MLQHIHWSAVVAAGALSVVFQGTTSSLEGTGAGGTRPASLPCLSGRSCGPAAGPAAVDSLADLGIGVIKVYDGLPREAYFAVAERTRELGMAFVGHVPLSVSLAEAIDAGHKSFEHVSDLWAACAAGGRETMGAFARAAAESGLPYIFAGSSLHDELALLVEAGLTPLEALQAATLNPARFLDRADDLGTVEEGKLADLVLLEANPLEDISNTERIRAVVADRRLYTRAELDRLLAEVEALVEPVGRR